jgi:hypothetical protein
MTNKRRSVEHDKTGAPFADAPRKNSAKKVRVSFVRDWYSPPVTKSGKVDYERAAEELRQEVTGGTLRFSGYLEDGGLGFPAEVMITSRSELDALIRSIRAVFKEGVRQSNTARQYGLEQCEERLGRKSEDLAAERRADGDRRAWGDRRVVDRRGEQLQTLIDLRREQRRERADRRNGGERRAA